MKRYFVPRKKRRAAEKETSGKPTEIAAENSARNPPHPAFVLGIQSSDDRLPGHLNPEGHPPELENGD